MNLNKLIRFFLSVVFHDLNILQKQIFFGPDYFLYYMD